MGRMYILENVINKQTNQVEGFCIIKSVVEKTNAKGSQYLDFELYDAGGSINAKLWDYSKTVHGEFASDKIIKIRATVNMFRDTEQLRIDRIRLVDREADNVDMSKLVPCAPFDSQWMFDELNKVIDAFSDESIKKLVKYMFNEKKEKLLNFPAAVKLHHAHCGGLLYHTYTMYKLARSICDVYPMLRSDIVFGGVILHDLAKMEELSVGELGLASGYSVQGQLIGHIALGVAQIEAVAQKLDIPQETKTIMQHIILAHHGTPEFGSPKAPMFPEAEVVSTVDMLDARMFEMFDVLESVENGSFSERQWALENRMLYKFSQD